MVVKSVPTKETCITQSVVLSPSLLLLAIQEPGRKSNFKYTYINKANPLLCSPFRLHYLYTILIVSGTSYPISTSSLSSSSSFAPLLRLS